MGQKLSETESRNSHTLHIDEASTLEQLTLINQEDMTFEKFLSLIQN